MAGKLRPDRRWSEVEDEVLRREALTTKHRELARRLGRSLASVRMRVSRLGLAGDVGRHSEGRAVTRSLSDADGPTR